MPWIPDQYDDNGVLEYPGYFVDDTGTQIDTGYSTNINGVTYTKDKDGNWTYEDSGGNIQPISQTEVDKLTNTANQTSNSAFQAKVKDPSFVKAINDALGTKFTVADLLKMGATGLGGIAGAMGLGGYSSKPTGYQGGIPQLTASQPMLTEPPPGRRPGSGGINYGTGVQYKDKSGNIVSDTSTPIADLYRKATQEGTYNEWGDQYGKGLTGAGGNSDLAKQIAALNQQRIAQLAASTPSGIQKIASVPTATKTDVPVVTNTGIANAVANTAANTAANTTATNTTSNGIPIADPSASKAGMTNVYSPYVDILAHPEKSGMIAGPARDAYIANLQKEQDALAERVANQQAAGGNKQPINWMPSPAGLNPSITQPKTAADLAREADLKKQWDAIGNPFTAGGGFTSQADYDKAVALKKQQDAEAQAKLDAWHVSPNSPLYSAYMNATGKRKDDIKSLDMENTQVIANRTGLSNMGYGDGFFTENGGLYDANGMQILPKANETSNTLDDPITGRPRFETIAERDARLKNVQTYLQSQGNIIDTVHPWNIAATDDKIKAAQDALAKLSANPGPDPQATLQNFLKTTTFTAEDLNKASNGLWGVEDLGKLMAGNTNQPKPDVGGVDTIPKAKALQLSTHDLPNVYDPNSTENSTANNTGSVDDILKSVGVAGGSTTSTPVNFGGIQDEQPKFNGGYPMPDQTTPTAAPAASSLADLAHNIYGRDLTADEQSTLSSKSADEAKAIMEQSMANWNASHPSTPQNNTSQPTAYAGDPANGAYVFARGGLTNLDHGGFVIPADVVSHFGNGSSEAGLKLLEHRLGAEPIRGHGDGMSDSIPASIEGREKALVANEEAYVSPKMVAQLGDGDMDEGSRKLKHMMEQIRKARTGTTQQGKQINPNKFMPGGSVGYAQGGGIKHFVTGTDVTSSAVNAGVTGTEQNLSNWVGPYATQMLGQAQALANTPYQAYTGPLTAGASDLQTQAFNTAANLPAGGGMATDFAQRAGNLSYTPTTTGFDATQAQQYMNPYLQTALNPQLEEARRQADIQAQADKAKATAAGAFGGGRQAIMASEGQRNLNSNLANITGQGYNTAYQNAMAQFNADQNRKMQEAQFGAGYGLQGLQTGISGANTASQIGINNLNTQASLGGVQRGIESEGIAADKAQFEAARQDPYTKLQFQQAMLNGLPISATNYTMAQPNAFQGAAGGATTVAQLLKNLGVPGY